jgi:hypothetical protein
VEEFCEIMRQKFQTVITNPPEAFYLDLAKKSHWILMDCIKPQSNQEDRNVNTVLENVMVTVEQETEKEANRNLLSLVNSSETDILQSLFPDSDTED